jgi:TQXA domain-containing protein
MKKRALAIFSAFMIAVNTLTPGLVPSKAAAENISENASGFNVAFKKADEEGNYLNGAKLSLSSGTDEVINWETEEGIKYIKLVPGDYVLKETSAPSGYKKADSIKFTVNGDGSISSDDSKLGKTPYVSFTDRNMYSQDGDYELDGAYSTNIYIKPQGSENTLKEVGYCFNMHKAEPENVSEDFTRPGVYEKFEESSFLALSDNASVKDNSKLANLVKQVVWKGYPLDKEGIQAKYKLSDEYFRALTQAAIWKYTDSAKLSDIPFFEGEVDKYLPAYNELTSDKTAVANNFKLNIYKFIKAEGETREYQNILSTSFTPGAERIPLITMVDKKGQDNPKIKVSKVQTGGFIELEGAELVVIKGTLPLANSNLQEDRVKQIRDYVKENISDENKWSWTTISEAKELDLKQGQYTLIELKAPENYKLADPIPFQISEDGKLSVPVNGEYTEKDDMNLVMEDELEKAQVTFSKVDIAGNEIAGAKIQIKNKNGELVEEWESEEGKEKIISLEPGEYTFQEEAAPEGYLAVTDFTFTVKEDGEVEVKENDDAKEENNKITVTDKADPDYKPIEKEVAFSKIEVNGSEELEGASLKVEKLKEDGSVEKEIKRWTSDKMAKTIKLSEGVYKMTEDQAPAGYEKAESIIFRITKDGKLEVKENDAWKTRENSTIQMEDKKSPQAPEEKLSITIHKYGSDNLEAELEGAKLSIVPEDDNLDSIQFKTSKDAKVVKLGQGNYKLQELVSPNLYKEAAPILFKVIKTDTGLKLQIKEGEDFIDVVKNEITMIDEKYPGAFTGELKTSVRVKDGQEELHGTSDKEVILQTAEREKEVEIVDDITYSGLVPGQKYSLSTKLMKVNEDGTSTLFVNEIITKQLANENGEGTWTVELAKVKLNPGEKYVIFEKATSETSIEYIEDGKIVNKQHLVSHENPNDKAQTIIVKKPEIPKEPENPIEPQEPNLPEEPKESEDPKEPESSEEPQVPEGPKDPDEPKIPEAPEKPKEPQAPEVPKEPQEPGTPEEPKTPQTPEEPKEPQVPEVPKEPQEPGKPEEPKTPQTPEDPKKPQVPEEPKSPEEPKKPDFPKKPESPNKPQLPETPEKPELPEQKIIKEVSFSKTEVMLARSWLELN